MKWKKNERKETNRLLSIHAKHHVGIHVVKRGLGQSAVHFHARRRGRNQAAVRVVMGMVVVVVVMVGVALMTHLLLLLLVQHLLVGLH